MGPLLELERQLAGAVSSDDLTGSVLQGLQRLVGASGSIVFCFDQPGVVTNQGGTLAAALREYPLELFEDDETWQVGKYYPAQQFIHFADARAAADDSPWLLAQLSPAIGSRAWLALLTKTERRVLRLLAEGLSNRRSARRLRCRARPSRRTWGRLLAKLSVRSRLEAATLARDAWDRS